MNDKRLRAAAQEIAFAQESRTVGEILARELPSLGVLGFRLTQYRPDAVGAERITPILQDVPPEMRLERLVQRYPNFLDIAKDLLSLGAPFDSAYVRPPTRAEEFDAFINDLRARDLPWRFYAAPYYAASGLSGCGLFLAEDHALFDQEQFLLRAFALAALDKVLGRRNAQAPLSPRQVEVLALCAAGKTDSDIAEIMGLSRATVHTHIEIAKRRLGVRTRVEAVVRALRSGWILV